VISYGASPRDHSTDFASGPIHRIGGRLTLNAEECIRELRQIDPDVINWYSGLISCFNLIKVAGKMSCEIVWNITQRRILLEELPTLRLRDIRECMSLGEIYSYSFLPDYFVRRASRSVHAIVVPSKFAETSLVRMGVPAGKIHRIPSGAETGLFSTPLSSRESNEIRQTNGFRDNDLLLCYLGPASSLRGCDTALEALHTLRRAFFNAKLLILARGGGPLCKSARKISGIKVIERILEPRSVARLLMACDIVVLPFRFWPVNECPVSLLEGMAAGKPVVTTPVGFVPDVIVDGVNGYLIRPGDARALAAKLQILANNEVERARVGNNARRLVLKEHGWGATARKTLDLFVHARP
jgi:glycosyltransferase involved in cell wall biosynthesis